MVLTNVPGPGDRLSVAGTPLSGVLVWAPCSGSIGMSVSVFSYAGRVTVGFLTDAVGRARPRRPRRRLPLRAARMRAGRAMSLTEVELATLAPERFDEVIAGEPLERFRLAVDRGRALMAGRTLWTVNSTARGGGVAEMLRSLIGYVRGAELDARWVVASAPPEFFAVTKRLHNRLHGADDGGPLGDGERALYERHLHGERRGARGAARSRRRGAPPRSADRRDDPAARGRRRAGRSGARTSAWTCPTSWRAPPGDSCMPYVEQADAVVFSRATYAWEGLDPARVTVIAPSIDAFSPKNQAMSFSGVTAVLRAAGLAADHHHASRAVFERLDGSVGTVGRAAELIEEHAAAARRAAGRAGLALGPAQGSARRPRRLRRSTSGSTRRRTCCSRDRTCARSPTIPRAPRCWPRSRPPGAACPRGVRRRVHLALLPMADADENAVIVNALQRRADVVVQKSLAEGFGLTVAEAMWKGRPVVASAVGGIQDQIEDGRTGYLVAPDDLAGFGARVTAAARGSRTPRSGWARRRGPASATPSSDRAISASGSSCSGRVLAPAAPFYGGARAAHADVGRPPAT